MEALLLVARRLKNDSESSSNHTCPVEDHSGPPIVPLVGGHTFHSFAAILSGACGLLSLLIILVAIFQHAKHYSSPVQQRQIIRILFLVPWVCFFCFLIVWQIKAGLYLEFALDTGCAFALSSFMLLMCDYILEGENGFQDLFGPEASKSDLFAPNSPEWLKRSWYLVLQFIPSSIILWIVTVIALAGNFYCEASNKPRYAHIWVTVLKVIVTVVAIIASIRFDKEMKKQLAPHKAMLKLFSFKGIIGLNATQTFLINMLITHDAIKPTKYMTFEDIQTGLPPLILACEMPLFSILLFFCFPASPYRNAKSRHGVFTAIFQALNIRDLLSAFVRGPMRLVREQQQGLIRQGSFMLMNTPAEDSRREYGHTGQGSMHV